METSLLDQGITLMLVGMGTVFVFLTVLVAGMTLLSAVAARFVREVVDTDATDEEIAAITSAITRFRNKTAN